MSLTDFIKVNSEWFGKRDKISANDPELQAIWKDLAQRTPEKLFVSPDFFGSGEGRAPIERTLRMFADLSEQEKDIIMGEKYSQLTASAGGVKKRDFWEAGFVLRGFPENREVYDELKARWAQHYKIIKPDGTQNWRTEPTLVRASEEDKNEAEAQFRIFSRKYRGLPEKKKVQVLGDLGDMLHLMWNPLDFIGVDYEISEEPVELLRIRDLLKYANPTIPKKIDALATPESMRKWGLSEDQVHIYTERDRLLRLHEGIAQPNLPAWQEGVGMAYEHGVARSFLELPQEEMDLFYKAHHFYKKVFDERSGKINEQGLTDAWDFHRAYSKGLAGSLRNGTMAPWAGTIIEHFRSGSVGGSNYRVLEGAA